MKYHQLPASVEAYLKEADFTGTELAIVKKLLEEEALTIRELSTRTGKSPGVLDQAAKKLLNKKILKRELFNMQPKYSLVSLQAIVDWVEHDMKAKQELQRRRHENFEAFVSNMSVDKNRPEMHYFDGEDGIRKAYEELLLAGKEIIGYLPIQYKEEDDPLRAFRVDYFRQRRKHGIFLRLIAHDTSLAHRFQSRDAFEYRKTVLVPAARHPISFEKLIIGDIVACINHTEKRACFIRYPELAELERRAFETLWNETTHSGVHTPKEQVQEEAKISIKTRTLSALREFFVSPRSIVMFVLFAVASAGITFGIYKYTNYLNIQRIREQATSIVATGVLQFDMRDIDQIHVHSDIHKPEYAKLIGQMNKIRSQNSQIKYMYILRPTAKQDIFEFVADADSIDPDAKKDYNADGKIDAADEDIAPGKIYDAVHIQVLRDHQYDRPIGNPVPYSDQWGTFISSFAPIRDNNNTIQAVLGVDVFASEVKDLNRQIFVPLYCFLGLFILFVLIRLAAFNRSLCRELLSILQMRKVLYIATVCGFIALIFTYLMYWNTLRIMKIDIANKMMSIAATAAPEFDAEDLAQLHFARDMKTDAYQRVFKKLNEVRDSNPNVYFGCIMRKSKYPNMMEFVADADSNYFPLKNKNGQPSNVEVVPPGTQYDISTNKSMLFAKGLEGPQAASEFYTDEWGTYLSGAAPIYDKNKRAVAIVDFDMDVTEVYNQIHGRFVAWVWFSIFFIFFLLFNLIFISKRHVK